MSAARQKLFRIERNRMAGASGARGEDGAFAPDGAEGGACCADALRHHEVMTALAEIRDRLGPAEREDGQAGAESERELDEIRRIKNELNQVYEAITRTKQEIATLRQTGGHGFDIGRMTDELGAIVTGTEQATETILNAAEEIDGKAGDLAAALQKQPGGDSAGDIQERVVRIFEACNFQDLTGQRITKVVNAFRFIEERVDAMMAIWGGIESFREIEPVALPPVEGDEALLNGPALEADADVASQDDIDALFD